MRRERILWITNVPSPYRVPTWERLAVDDELLVAFHGHQQPNRPAWRVPAGATFDTTSLATRFSRPGSDTPLTGFPVRRDVRRVLEWNPTVVVMTGWGDTASVRVGLRLRTMRDAPLLIAYYGTARSTRSTSPLVAMARRRYFRGFDAFVTYGTESTDLLKEDGVDPSIIVTGFNSVDVLGLHERVAAHRHSGLPVRDQLDGRHRFLFAGQLIDRKGPDLAIEAMADARLQTSVLSIVGAGPMEGELRRLVRHLGLDGRIEFVGLKDTGAMPSEFARHDTLVMPSRAEVWGLVSNEALACGLHAVVSSAAGCAQDLAAHRGVFVAHPTVAGVADAMASSLASWQGPINTPRILDHDATAMAADVRAAIAIARGTTDAAIG